MEVKVTLLNTYIRDECVNKDLAGGYGTATHIGDGFFSRLIEIAKRSKVKIPILSMAYLAAIFGEHGHEVNVMECKGIPKDLPESDLVIIPSSALDYRNELRVAKYIKKIYRMRVGFTGPFAAVKSRIYLQSGDFIIKGEPEQVAIKVADGSLAKLRGVIESKNIGDLNQLPFPAWEHFPIKTYSYSPMIRAKPFLTFLASRGCPYGCNYCPYIVTSGRRWRKRSVENVLEELEFLVSKYGVKGLQFRDPIFSMDKKRAWRIAHGMINQNLNISWGCETRPDALDYELIDKMAEAGLKAVNVGVESADPSVLKKSSRKPAALRYQEDMINYCEDSGIRVAAFYIIGLLGDTEESILNTIEYAKQLNTTVAQFTIMTPYPGTEFYENIKHKITTIDWEKYDAYTPIFEHDVLSRKELAELKENAFISYYFRFPWILKHGFKVIG